MSYLETAWRAPDEGIWEVRGQRRHFVHSKVMAWVAFDRAVQMIEHYGHEGPVERWRELRDEIHREVCERGFDAERSTFTQSYGSRALDAATLMIPLVGFLPPDDERVIGTVEAIQRELMPRRVRAALRLRRAADDGLPPGEGAFLPCSFWLADCLTPDRPPRRGARSCSTRLAGLANDVGLLAEEYDPRRGRQVGNFPQAFTHVGLVNTAAEPATARSRRRPPAAAPRPWRHIDARDHARPRARPTRPALEEVPEPAPEEGAILVDGVALGICGTDAEIVRGDYGEAPPGAERLILGHESLGRVAEAPDGSGFAPGDLVVGIVRRPDPVPCPSCAAGEWDFCRNGGYTERGIKALHGYGSERWRIEPGVRRQARSGAGPARRADGADDRRREGVGADRPRARPARRSGPSACSSPAPARSGCSPRCSRASAATRSTCSTAPPTGPSRSWCATSARRTTRARLHRPRPGAGHHRRGHRRQRGRARRDEPHAPPTASSA